MDDFSMDNMNSLISNPYSYTTFGSSGHTVSPRPWEESESQWLVVFRISGYNWDEIATSLDRMVDDCMSQCRKVKDSGDWQQLLTNLAIDRPFPSPHPELEKRRGFKTKRLYDYFMHGVNSHGVHKCYSVAFLAELDKVHQKWADKAKRVLLMPEDYPPIPPMNPAVPSSGYLPQPDSTTDLNTVELAMNEWAEFVPAPYTQDKVLRAWSTFPRQGFEATKTDNALVQNPAVAQVITPPDTVVGNLDYSLPQLDTTPNIPLSTIQAQAAVKSPLDQSVKDWMSASDQMQADGMNSGQWNDLISPDSLSSLGPVVERFLQQDNPFQCNDQLQRQPQSQPQLQSPSHPEPRAEQLFNNSWADSLPIDIDQIPDLDYTDTWIGESTAVLLNDNNNSQQYKFAMADQLQPTTSAGGHEHVTGTGSILPSFNAQKFFNTQGFAPSRPPLKPSPIPRTPEPRYAPAPMLSSQPQHQAYAEQQQPGFSRQQPVRNINSRHFEQPSQNFMNFGSNNGGAQFDQFRQGHPFANSWPMQ